MTSAQDAAAKITAITDDETDFESFDRGRKVLVELRRLIGLPEGGIRA